MVATVALLELCSNTYHLTHYGRGSGASELVSTSLVSAGVGLVFQAGKSGGNVSAKRWQDQ